MSSEERGALPDGTTVYGCPIEACGWTFAPQPADASAPGPVVAGATLEESISLGTLAILQEHYAGAEKVIEAHLSTHTLLEWVTEVMRLRGEVVGLRKVADAASDWDALVSAAAPMSYVVEARDLERREREAEEALRDAVTAMRERAG